LLFGARRKKSTNLERDIAIFLTKVDIKSFDASAARHYADIRANLEAKGKPIADMDIEIAACARSCPAVLVTNNIKHYADIEGLTVENWVG
jgi:tRNA(fMet)-specific endonuclease VapC